MKDLFAKFPEVLLMHTMEIVEKLSPRITDTDKAVRQTFLLLLRTSILPSLSQVLSSGHPCYLEGLIDKLIETGE